MGFRRVLNTSARIRRGPGHALAAFRHQPARTWQAEAGKQKKRSNAANTRKRQGSAAQPNPRLLRFQEQIKGPKNASIARFDGLGCYQSHSEISDVFRAGSAAKTALQTGFKKVRCGFNAGRACAGCFRKPVCPDLAAESEARKAFKRRKHAKVQGSAAQPKPRLLRFQERIKGPKNASIARFDGLRCYQSRSEIGNGFWARAAKSVLQMGFRRVLNTSARIRRGPGHALAAFRHQPARTWQAEAGKQKKRSNAANVRKRKEAQPSPIPFCSGFRSK